MIIISGKRGTGKTKELIKRCLESDIPIVCVNKLDEDIVKDKSRRYFNTTVKTVLLSELPEFSGNQIGVDDLDSFLEYLIRSTSTYHGRIKYSTIVSEED